MKPCAENQPKQICGQEKQYDIINHSEFERSYVGSIGSLLSAGLAFGTEPKTYKNQTLLKVALGGNSICLDHPLNQIGNSRRCI